MYDKFEKIVESELEDQLKRCGWAVPDFHTELGKALEGVGESGQNGEIRAHASARGLLELLCALLTEDPLMSWKLICHFI